jgi:hypothetical protein
MCGFVEKRQVASIALASLGTELMPVKGQSRHSHTET